ncbi:MAG: VWA domain-containing protein [Corynebacteriales bacterium]|nr:VWA domain-containing protein [Mycobacteriales bacterium]
MAKTTGLIRAASALALVGALLVVTPVAYAEGNKPSADYAPMMLVLDASGSMTEADAGNGQTRMDAAKQAANTLIDELPAQAKVGLTTYGTGTGSTDAEKAAGCQDIQVLNEVGKVNKTALHDAVNGLNPRGYTPIGNALKKAAEALPDEGPRSIVLVSDGIDTCAPPPPCEVAQELAKQGVDMRIHTVGFQVDAQAREQLTCVAQATGGNYYDAADGNTLGGILPRVVDRALRDYEPRGIPVDGTAEPKNAPLLKAGQYLDSMKSPETKYYSVDVPKGARVYFTGTVVLPSATTDGYKYTTVGAIGPDGQDCLVAGDTALAGDGFEGFPVSTTAKVPLVDSSSCTQQEGRYTFSIERKEDALGGDEVRPVEIFVFVEPPLKKGGDSGPQAASSDGANNGKAEFVAPGGDPVAVTGGGSFADATALPGSGTYSDSLRDGETVFYKVNVDWGQALSYRITAGPNPNATGLDAMMSAGTILYTPLREDYDRNVSVMDSKTIAEVRPVSTTPVLYNNREAEGNPYVGPNSVAGDYYIGINTRRRFSETQPPISGEVPFKLEVSVAGEPVAAPEYVELEGSSFDTTSENAGGHERAKPSSALVWAGLVAGVVLVAGAGTTLLVLSRRRRR